MKSIPGTITPRNPRRSRRKKALRLSALALCAALLAPVCALASSVPTSVRVALISPSDLPMRPLEIMDRDMVSVLDLVYESVVDLNDDRQPEMGLGLAESWEVSNNGQVWIFTLRQGVYFHDGREMKASDVAATMDAIAAIAREQGLSIAQVREMLK